jgi:hypothetical protein
MKMGMSDELQKLSDELGLEYDAKGNYIIRLFEEDNDIVAKTLSYETLDELLQHQIDNENYEGAATLTKIIQLKNGIQEI